MLSRLLRFLSWRRSDPAQHAPYRVSNADPWLAEEVRVALNPDIYGDVPHIPRTFRDSHIVKFPPGNASPGGHTGGGQGDGRGAFSLSHDGDM